MKILYLHHGYVLGGAPVSLLYLVKEMEQKPGMEISLACHSSDMQEFYRSHLKSEIKPWTDPLTIIGKVITGWTPMKTSETKKTFFFALLNFPYSIYLQVKLIRQNKPDIIHLNSATMFSSGIAARIAGVPIVWHIRECVQGYFNQLFCGWFIRTLAAKVITISPIEAKRLGIDKRNKVITIFNPINFESLHPEMYDSKSEKIKIFNDENTKVIITFGGVNPRKGTLEIVDAMRYTDRNVKLLVLGPPLAHGLYDTQIKEILDQLPQDKVLFTGNVEDIASYLAASEILLFIGTKPHFPRPIFEAWMMEKPVIVYEMDGISNNVDHGEDGLIVKELSGKAIGTAINDLLSNPRLMEKMGKNGKIKAETSCDPKIIAQQVNEIYQNIHYHKNGN